MLIGVFQWRNELDFRLLKRWDVMTFQPPTLSPFGKGGRKGNCIGSVNWEQSIHWVLMTKSVVWACMVTRLTLNSLTITCTGFVFSPSSFYSLLSGSVEFRYCLERSASFLRPDSGRVIHNNIATPGIFRSSFLCPGNLAQPVDMQRLFVYFAPKFAFLSNVTRLIVD